MKPNKKWLVNYSYDNIVPINQKEYEALLGAVRQAEETNSPKTVKLLNGSLITTNFKNVMPNPEWVDPVNFRRKEIYYQFRRDYMERRENGEKITWKEYTESRKPEAKKMMKEFMETLTDD